MCTGKLEFQVPQDPNCAAGLFFRVPGWPPGVSRRHDQVANAFEMPTAGPIEASSKSGLPDGDASGVRPWWPVGEMGWTTADPAGYWGPGEIDWDCPQLFVFHRPVNEKLYWSHFQFDRTQAVIRLPDVFQDTAHMVWEDKTTKKTG